MCRFILPYERHLGLGRPRRLSCVMRNAEEAARKTEEKASADAELMLQRAQEDSNAFWQDVNELLQKRLFSDGGADHGE